MTEEEYFRKNYPDSCYGDKPLSPHWDFFQDGVEFGERDSEKRIEKLEKENIVLHEMNVKRIEYYNQLTKAKEIIRAYKNICNNAPFLDEKEEELKEKAEQFLKDLEK